jgi:hypothetical protein
MSLSLTADAIRRASSQHTPTIRPREDYFYDNRTHQRFHKRSRSRSLPGSSYEEVVACEKPPVASRPKTTGQQLSPRDSLLSHSDQPENPQNELRQRGNNRFADHRFGNWHNSGLLPSTFSPFQNGNSRGPIITKPPTPLCHSCPPKARPERPTVITSFPLAPSQPTGFSTVWHQRHPGNPAQHIHRKPVPSAFVLHTPLDRSQANFNDFLSKKQTYREHSLKKVKDEIIGLMEDKIAHLQEKWSSRIRRAAWALRGKDTCPICSSTEDNEYRIES